MNETITVYVTKYALTTGIIKCSGKISDGRFFPNNPYRFNTLVLTLVLDGFMLTNLPIIGTTSKARNN